MAWVWRLLRQGQACPQATGFVWFDEAWTRKNTTPSDRTQQGRSRSGLLHELRLQLHCAKALDLAIDIVIAFDQANVLHLGADLDR